MFQFNTNAIAYIVGSILCICLIVVSLRRRSARSYALILIAVALWCASAALEQCTLMLHIRLICKHFGWTMLMTIAPLWCGFIIENTGGQIKSKRYYIAAAALYSALLVCQVSNPFGLFYLSYYLRFISGRFVVGFLFGPLYYIFIVILALIIGLSCAIAIKASSNGRFSRTSLIIFLSATMFSPFIGTLIIQNTFYADLFPLLCVCSAAALGLIGSNLEFSELISSVRRLAPSLQSGVVVINRAGVVQEMNDHAAELLAVDNWQGARLEALLGIDNSDVGMQQNMELELATSTGTRHLRINMSKMTDTMGKVCGKLALINDIGGIKAAEQKLHYVSNYDRITGLPNRFHFMQRLEEAMAQCNRDGTSCVVLVLDIFGFRHFNDVHGYDDGDALLRILGERLTKLMENSELVCRFGSDDFYVLMRGLTDPIERVHQIANSIFNAMKVSFQISGRQERIRINLGAACAPQDAQTAYELINRANTALSYSNALNNETLVLYSDDLTQERLDQERLIEDLSLGLMRGEFEVIYQPQMDLSCNDVFGVEALVRWHNPRRGMVSPGIFIPLAEESGFINDLGLYVLEQSCRQLASWRNDGYLSIKMSVNISVVQLLDEGFVDKVFHLVYKYSIPLAFLELEITESIALDTNQIVRDNVQKLRESGFRIAIDDFGMGHSTLMYLTHFPVHTLKLDAALVRYVQRNRNAAVIVRAIAMICQSMGIQMVAEGVETTELCETMQRIGCDLFQGYLFSRPLDVITCTQFFKDGPLIWRGAETMPV